MSARVIRAKAGGAVPNVTALRQNADHSVTLASSASVFANPPNVTRAEVDGDGRLDMLIGHDDAFALMTGRGDGSFGAEDLYGVPRPDSLSGSFVVSAQDASGRFVVEFNGQLFVRNPLAPSRQGQRSAWPIRPLDVHMPKRH